jgi:cell division septum initiation protein DivIVA
MPQLRDFLSRFRPAGAPGAAARVGVPADRSRELEAEVGPVLALLEDVDAECARILDQARRDADDVRAAALAQAAAITADGDRTAQGVREEAARQVLDEARNEASQAVETAQRQAARIRELARLRMPALADRAVAEIRQLLAEG